MCANTKTCAMADAGLCTGAQLKILAIHGYRQSAQTFREKTGAFRKVLKKKADLVFSTAPNRVPPLEVAGENAEQTDGDDSMGWWFSRQDDYFNAQDPSDCCKGFDSSLQLIHQTIKEQGPFDGVLGFSQGASMVSLLLGLQEQQSERWFDFAILVAGFKSKSTPHDAFYSQTVSIPTLHVFGETDKVIPKEMSEALLPFYKDPVVLQHPGGHFVPAGGPQKKVYQEFFDKMLEKKAQKS